VRNRLPAKVLIRKILVPVDGSESSMRAAEFAIDISKMKEAKVIALHVIHVPAYAYSGIEGTPTLPVSLLEAEKEAAKAYVDKVYELAKSVGVEVETKIIEDRPSVVHAITDFAEKQGCDLIVMGTKGRSGIKKFLLGSVADGVLTYAHCPVLVVR